MKASEKLIKMIQEQKRTIIPGVTKGVLTPTEVYALKALRGYESAHAAIHQEQKEAYAALLPAKKVPTRGSRYWDKMGTPLVAPEDVALIVVIAMVVLWWLV